MVQTVAPVKEGANRGAPRKGSEEITSTVHMCIEDGSPVLQFGQCQVHWHRWNRNA